MRERSLILITMLAAMLTAVQLGAAPKEDRLDRFVGGFEGLRGWDAQQVGELRASLDALSDDQRRQLESNLDAFTAWEQLPDVMAEVDESMERRRFAEIDRIIADASSPLGPTEEVRMQRFREDLIYLTEQLALFEPVLGPEFGARVAATRTKFEQIPSEALPALFEAWQKRPALELRGTSGGSGPRLEANGGCDTSCGIDVGCWVDAVDCLIDSVDDLFDQVASLANQVRGYVTQIANFTTAFFNDVADVFVEIGQLPSQIEAFFTSMFGDIESFFENILSDLLAVVPTTPQQAFALIEQGTGLDFTSTSWITGILNQVPTLEPPCPSADTEIPGLGTVGTRQAEFLCERKVEWLAGMLYDIAPSDTYFVPVKLVAAGAYYPINYLCLCVESQAAIEFADAQAAHRALTEANLDVTVSSRSTQTSVNQLNAGIADVTTDVAAIETKLDILEAKLDTLNASQGDQDVFLREFEDLLIRIDIENNLLENNPDAVASFQMPQAWGGLLQKVRETVAASISMTATAGQAAFGAERELARGDAFLSTGEFLKAFEAYRAAYTEVTK